MLSTKVVPIEFNDSGYQSKQHTIQIGENYKPNKKINFFISIRIVIAVLVSFIILLFGIVIIAVFLIYTFQDTAEYIKVLKDKTNNLVEIETYKLLNKAIMGVEFFGNLLEKVQCEKHLTEYCLYKKENTSDTINILSDEMKFFDYSTIYLKTHSLLYGRYAEMSKNGILTGYDVDTDIYEFVSFNSDESLYNTDYYNNTDPMKAVFQLAVPPGRYKIEKKNWFKGVAETSVPHWSTYYSANKIQAICYSVPVFFGNGTLKGMINVCFESHITRSVLHEIKHETGIGILLLDNENNIISTTYDNVNVSKTVYDERKGWIETTVNVSEVKNDLVLESYEYDYLVNKGNIRRTSNYYISCYDVTGVENTGWKKCLYLDTKIVENPVIVMTGIIVLCVLVAIVISIIISIVIVNALLNSAIKPINKLIKKITKYEIDEFNPPKIFPKEFSKVVFSTVKNYNTFRLLRDFLPDIVIESAVKNIVIPPKICKVCVAYIDLVDFTKDTQNLNPNDIVEILDKFSGTINQYVDNKKIQFDKLIGDCVMYYCIDEDGKFNGCFEMINFAVSLIKRATGSFKFRIGIDYGECFVGCVGRPRKQITVIGTSANVASRVESLCKAYDVSLLITNNVYRSLRQDTKATFKKVTVNDIEIRGIKDQKYNLYSLV